MKLIFTAIIIFLFISGCSDSSSSTPKTNTNVAYFEDSLVNGLTYKCDNRTGITGDYNKEDGSFEYTNDCEIIFSLGKVYIGSIQASSINKTTKKVYPTDLFNDINTTNTNDIRVINIIRLLQSLDENNDASDGIVITSEQRDKLRTVTGLDLTDPNISISDLNSSVITADSSKVLISKNKALEHFEQTIRDQVDSNIDTIGPNTPFLTTNITAINNSLVLNRTVELNGEAGSAIFIAYNTSGDESNLNFIKQNGQLGDDGKINIILSFDDNSASYFHYYVYLEDKKGYKSEILHIKVFKDIIQPVVDEKNLTLSVFEQQNFIQNMNASDNSILRYEIVSKNEDLKSVDYTLFQVDSTGNITFIIEPNYDDNVNVIYSVVARAIDEAGNKVDVTVNVSLINILDNPPVLSENFYEISILEEPQNGYIIFDSNTTIDTNLSKNPDNDPTLSPIIFKLQDNTNIFEINSTTGKVSIKDTNDDLFDFEKVLKNTIDLNISVENNNTTSSGNISYVTLRVNIVNKIDTTPSFTLNSTTSISEHNASSIVVVDTAIINTTLSDFDTTMTFSIVNNDGNFSINANTGVITTNGDNLDYETTDNYILTIRATNILDTSKSINNFFDVNISVDILDVIDMAPSISYTIINGVIPESTNIDFKVATIDLNGTNSDENITNNFIIINAGSSVPFDINTTNGEIFTSRSLLNDYIETGNNNSITTITLNVKATNIWWNNTVNDSNTVSFDINITNVIDNAPVLLNENPTLDFFENNITINGNNIGSLIYQIKKNGTIYDSNNTHTIDTYKYNIVSGNNDLNGSLQFDLNRSSGKITLNRLFDWEEFSSHTLILNATNVYWDNTEHNSSNISLNIDINNTIEKPPKIRPSISPIKIHEHIDINEIITLIETNSTQKDEQTIDTLTIVASGNDGNFGLSAIDPLTSLPFSELSTIGKLDFESNESYTLEINATNSFGSTILPINIEILDDVDKNLTFLILAISYNDVVITTSEADLETVFFTAQTGKTRLSDYFKIVSKGKFTIIPAQESEGISNNGIININLSDRNHTGSPTQLRTDIKDALSLASNSDVNFSNFDTNLDGNISNKELQIIFIVAGGERTYDDYDVAYNQDANHSITATSGTFTTLTLNSKDIKTNYYVIGELIGNKPTSIGLIAKIVSEKLLGFIKGNSGYKFEEFDLMDKGFLGHDSNTTIGIKPVHPSSINKIKQGWVRPKILARGFNDTIKLFNTHDNNNKFNAYRINDSSSSIYYILENRNKTTNGSNTNFDNGLDNIITNFNGGIVVWKIDDANNQLEIIDINSKNVFRPENTVNDLPFNIRNNIFEFINTGSITDDSDSAGSKEYSIEIKVK